MAIEFQHRSLQQTHKTTVVFTAFSKRNFYLRYHISAFVLLQGATPMGAFMNFDYNLSGLVDKTLIRIANNTMIAKADELWVFGEVSDGALVEVYLAKKRGIPIRFFTADEVLTNIREITADSVRLENVSDWMWEWTLQGKNMERWHPRLRLKKLYPLVYPAYSKRNLYLQVHVSKFCIEKRVLPLNPFMLFRYFLGDMVPRKTIYRANNNLVRISDALWTFGEISDGVLAEMLLTQEKNGEMLHYKLAESNPVKFRQITPARLEFEDPSLEKFRSAILT